MSDITIFGLGVVSGVILVIGLFLCAVVSSDDDEPPSNRRSA
jgi:hypothetical protein